MKNQDFIAWWYTRPHTETQTQREVCHAAVASVVGYNFPIDGVWPRITEIPMEKRAEFMALHALIFG